MKTCIFFTMQTSATASMWRIFTTMISGMRFAEHYVDKFYREGRLDQLRTDIYPKDGRLIQFNNPPLLNLNQNLSDFDFIINYRGPRDRLCNAFHWMLIHPTSPNESPASIENRSKELLKQGIDNWVIRHSGLEYYDNIFSILDNISMDQISVLTYSRLCLDFDSFVAKSAKALGIELTDSLKVALEIERTEKLTENPSWIGNQWKGSDVLPGRFKRELKDETIAILNDRFRGVLEKMAKYDPDYATGYLDGLA